MAIDTRNYLPDDVLAKVDRAAMGVSLEARAPFLDRKVLDFAWRLPMAMKIAGGRGKHILRRVLDRHVPRDLIERPKQGFAVPVGRWMRTELRDWAESLLSAQALDREGLFNPGPVRAAWDEHLSGRRDHDLRLWSVLTAQAWAQAQREPLAASDVAVVLFGNTDWYLYNFRLPLLHRLRAEGTRLILISPPGEYGEKLRAMGFDWRPLPMERRSLNPLAETRLLMHIACLLRAEKVAIIHGFTIKPAIYAGIAGRLAGVKGRVSAVAGLGFVFISDSLKARLLRPVVHTLAWLAFGGSRARLIVQNPDDHEVFVGRRLVDPARVHIIPGSGVDLTRFQVSTRVRGEGEPLKVLLAARMLWDKGLAEFVEAARILKGQGRDIRFLLAGEPDPGNPATCKPEDLIGWAAAGLVEHLGHVDDMAALLADVDVVVLPSYREGLPKTLIEAAGCALPLVTTDVPGCREVVTHEEDGLLVTVREHEGLVEAIARLDDDADLRRRLGLAAREKALRLFDVEIVMARTLGVYRELLDRR
eukprot:gene17043-16866_t